MRLKNLLTALLIAFLFTNVSVAQDTTIVQTLTFDSTGRNYVFEFPADTGQSYERIIMEYRMRCKGGLISTTSDRNKGCGEWDYSCNTYITDSAYTDSIKASAPSHTISGFGGTTYYYTSSPTYSYTQYTQKDMAYLYTVSETSGTVGAGTDLLPHPFGASNQYSKTQYLWTATELGTAGITAGDITSLRLDVNSATSNSNFLRIRMKHTAQTTLYSGGPDTTSFTEVYFLNTTLAAGINNFLFYNKFNWDGTSNVIVELSYSNAAIGTNNILNGHDAGFTAGLVSNSTDYSMNFNGAGYADLGTSAFSGISDEITISLWCYGNPDILPVNTNIFEGVDAQNDRQVNSHLPWSNSRVYWDCGNDGGYDRIDQSASAQDFEGKWNHWAFTKNATTGDMKMYLNGALFHSGTAKTNLIDLATLRLAASKNNTNNYFGKIDEFRVWNKELTQTEIADWMLREVDATHPQYAGLIAYYNMNEGTGFSITDASPAAETGVINGNLSWDGVRGKDIFKGFTETNMRPNMTFVQGVYTQVLTDIVVRDSIQNAPDLVNSFHLVSNSLVPLDTNFFYQSGDIYVYDDISGTVVDTISILPQDTITITTLDYHHKTPSKFEIMSFVTPYGINLDLGLDGKMWAFDVTDFKPILNGSKRLELTRGGQNQEEMDIRFLFIEGTPPRDVLDIRQIWRVDSRNYTQIMNNEYFEPVTYTLDSTASDYKIRTAITGHGQEGEFIPRVHQVNIDGGPAEFSWLVLKECGDNEIFPQGGTWIYDRTGWCPGKATDLEEFPLYMVAPGQTIDIDYTVTSGSGDSRYIVNNQLVSYGAPNFVLDARVVDIKQPSLKTEYLRDNPRCIQPSVIIQNTGSTNLTSLTITYNVLGGTTETYNWSGSLGFLQMEEVQLPITSQAFWSTSASSDVFEVSISAPNGGTDGYANNNSMSTP
ncbi:MAG: hypothetical protein HKO56_09675, partial [Bacteroidia bacterium]|nr:hypothetical protein [Bacteroidia bacterium]